LRLGVQPGDCGRANEPAFRHIALPVNVADEAAFAEGSPAGEASVALAAGWQPMRRPVVSSRLMQNGDL